MDTLFSVILAAIFIGFGVFLVYLSIKLKRTTEHMNENCTEEVTAVVSDVIIREMQSNRVTLNTYYPVFRYTYCGTEYNVQSKEGSLVEFVTGQTIGLLINPENPEEYCFSDANRYASSSLKMLLVLVGATVVIVSIITLMSTLFLS